MEELYALERTEALRRAEYEIRHEEALRRAEYEARRAEMGFGVGGFGFASASTSAFARAHGRVSKSAEVTPAVTPFYTDVRDREEGFFGVSRERERGVGGGNEDDGVVVTGRRRFSASGRRESLPIHPHSSGHIVDGLPTHSRDSRAHPHPHAAWGHPYHVAHRTHTVPGVVAGAAGGVQAVGRHEDSPSPMSSDSDSFQVTQSPVSTTAPHSQAHAHSHAHSHGASYQSLAGLANAGTKQEYAQHPTAYTPSTSPFLGGLRTLNIHSGAPSRAPSPFRLPPATLDNAASAHHSPTEEYAPAHTYQHHYHYPYAHGRSSVPSSPPLSGRMAKRGSSGDLVSYAPYHHQQYQGHISGHGYAYGRENEYAIQRSASSTSVFSMPGTYSHERDRDRERERGMERERDRTLAPLPTPQLSSGPSSSGSSPRSYSHQLVAGTHGAESVSSSRAPSPSRMSASTSPRQSYSQAQGSGQGRDHPHHHHLAHSVRMAFGMTPIHPRTSKPPSSSNPNSHGHPYSHSHTSSTLPTPPDAHAHPHSHGHSHSVSHSYVAHNGHGGAMLSTSMPASRSSSPLITLPPLNLPSSPSSPTKISALLAPAPPPVPSPATASESGEGQGSGSKDAEMNIENGDENKDNLEGVTQEKEAEKEVEMVDGQEKTVKVELPGFSEFTAATGLSA